MNPIRALPWKLLGVILSMVLLATLVMAVLPDGVGVAVGDEAVSMADELAALEVAMVSTPAYVADIGLPVANTVPFTRSDTWYVILELTVATISAIGLYCLWRSGESKHLLDTMITKANGLRSPRDAIYSGDIYL